MSRKTLIVADPGIDGAFALSVALLDPELEVLGLAATAGNVDSEQATRNMLVVMEQLDPTRWPRVGSALPITYDRNATGLHGSDGLGGIGFPCVELAHMLPSDKLIADVLRQYPREVAVLVLGPATVLARAFDHHPDLPAMIERLIVVGGTWHEAGNASAVAEFHFYCDPPAAREVLRCGAPTTLVPLDASRKLIFSPTELDQLPPVESRVGRFLRQIVPAGIAPTASLYGVEGVHLDDVVGLVALARPELLTLKPVMADVETRGDLTRGALVIDTRWGTSGQANVDLVVDADWPAVREYVRGVLGRVTS